MNRKFCDLCFITVNAENIPYIKISTSTVQEKGEVFWLERMRDQKCHCWLRGGRRFCSNRGDDSMTLTSRLSMYSSISCTYWSFRINCALCCITSCISSWNQNNNDQKTLPKWQPPLKRKHGKRQGQGQNYGTIWKVLLQTIPMCNMKAISLLVRKVWLRIIFFSKVGQTSRSKSRGKKLWYQVKGLVTRNTHVQYEKPVSSGKTVMVKVKIFQK